MNKMSGVWFDRLHIERDIEFESIDHTAQTTVSLRYRDKKQDVTLFFDSNTKWTAKQWTIESDGSQRMNMTR